MWSLCDWISVFIILFYSNRTVNRTPIGPFKMSDASLGYFQMFVRLFLSYKKNSLFFLWFIVLFCNEFFIFLVVRMLILRVCKSSVRRCRRELHVASPLFYVGFSEISSLLLNYLSFFSCSVVFAILMHWRSRAPSVVFPRPSKVSPNYRFVYKAW